MASYTTTAANLLEFAQSRLMTGIDAKRPERVFVCIPIDVNEIKTSTDSNGKARADARLALWPMRNREAYLTRINAKRMAAGDQPKTLDQMPTHTLQVAHSDEFIMANIKKFGQALVMRVLEGMNSDYAASIADDNPEDTNSKLYKCIRTAMNPSLGNFYQHVPEQRITPAQAQVAQGVQGYTATAETDPLAYLAQQGGEEEDLPF
jgi:hypothetical protein